MIDVTGIDLVKFVKKVYDLSVPQGMGFMHFTPGPLDDGIAKEIVKMGKKSPAPIQMDCVGGRACKMDVWKKDGKLLINDSWYDHTDSQLSELLSAFNIEMPEAGEHGCACNCVECQIKEAV